MPQSQSNKNLDFEEVQRFLMFSDEIFQVFEEDMKRNLKYNADFLVYLPKEL